MQAIKVTYGTDRNGNSRYIASCDARRMRVYAENGNDDAERLAAAQKLADALGWGRVAEAGSIDKGGAWVYMLIDFPNNNPVRKELVGHAYDISSEKGWKPHTDWDYNLSNDTLFLGSTPLVKMDRFEDQNGDTNISQSDFDNLALYIAALLNGKR